MSKIKTDLAKPDPELKDFLRNPERFADIFNGVCFGGNQVLIPENLSEMDTDASGVIVSKEYRESIIRNRDVLKGAVIGTKLIILGEENQVEVDYTMPLRTMVYDGLNYTKEIKGKKKDELILTPIITVVLYYGKKQWDGPRCLKDMMGDIPEELQPFISDYKMTLVEVLHDSQYEFHNEDVKMLFEYSQALIRRDRAYIELLDQKYVLNNEVVYAISKFVDIQEVKDNLLRNGKEKISMCELFDDIRAEGKAEGKAEGICIFVHTLQEMQCDAQKIKYHLMTKFDLTESDANQFLAL